jgi:hypothetical protein
MRKKWDWGDGCGHTEKWKSDISERGRMYMHDGVVVA